jgi:protocatechuate 3,4-dioxygenase beta subunit
MRTAIKHKTGLPAALLTVAVVAYGQTSRGTVTGTVQDPSGAAVAAAQVALTAVETGVRLSTFSNDTGVYRFDAVDPGAYELEVAHRGFQAYVASGIGVEANRVTTVDPRLTVGHHRIHDRSERRIERVARQG